MSAVDDLMQYSADRIFRHVCRIHIQLPLTLRYYIDPIRPCGEAGRFRDRPTIDSEV